MKAIVFGATNSAKEKYREISLKYDIVALCDNDINKVGGEIEGIKIMHPNQILEMEWDEIIIMSTSAMSIIRQQLIDLGVQESKINTSYVDFNVRAREVFVKDFAKIVYKYGLQGNVAEAGVFQGEFAKVMNECFPDRKLYLFDTFEGFAEQDVVYEKENKFSEAEVGNLNITSVELVLSKMKYLNNCIVRKGYFPDTTEGINDKFSFVNLDMDLYKPTLEGLKYFWPRMIDGGIILVHDFFSHGYEGVNKAVDEFIEECHVTPFAIGDGVSIAIQK